MNKKEREDLPSYGDLFAENFKLKHNEKVMEKRINKTIELLDKLNIQLKDVLKTEINIKEISDIKEILKGEDNE